MQKTLDLSIKQHEIGITDGGFLINKKTYSSYMDNDSWTDFENDMIKNHRLAYDEYGAGSGGEMKPKGQFPPKMASYGSSSRMIYKLSKEIDGFRFEYQLSTKVGGVANLDGFLEKEDKLIFVEAKCREPYGRKPHLIESKYRDLYNYINEDNSCNLKIDINDRKGKMEVAFSVLQLVISSFDIKQMISHLLGVAVKLLNAPTTKKISFLYLCYNPNFIEIIDSKKKEKIFYRYEKMCNECEAIEFSKLFETVLRYLNDKLKVGSATENEIEEMISNFHFQLCDQSDYISFLK